MDVAVKGLFWLLEGCRVSPTFRQFVLIGGDASVGHFFYPHPVPVVETQPHTAYPGCYALSKALEEAMLQQYYVQYDFNGCCLRAPWIMEKDDLRAHLSFGPDVFGGPRWCDVVGAEAAAEYEARGAIPVLQDREGNGLCRATSSTSKTWPMRSWRRSTSRGRASSSSTSAWTSRSTTRASARIWRAPAAARWCRSRAFPLHLAGQQQGQVPARLASAL